MYLTRPSWSRVGSVLVSVLLATSPLLPSAALAATSESVDKAETVHVQTTPDGAITSITVQDTLANGDGATELEDRSTLSDIDAGEDGPSYSRGNDDTLTWAANGKQVSYEGTSTEEPPVRIEVTYLLDGVQKDPADLAGASGHLVVRLDYHNNSSQMRTVGNTEQLIYTPFVCMTAAMLDGDVFSNVQVENGKVIEDKGGVAVIGYALPGLRESMALEDDLNLEIPDYVQIEADVTDLAMDPLYTMVTPELFTDFDTSDLDFGDMGDGTAELQDAMMQLVAGSGTLTDALRQIATGSSQMKGGLAEFQRQLGLLPQGMSALSSGASSLADGMGTARDVASQLAQGTEALPQLTAGSTAGISQAQGAVGVAKQKVGEATSAAGEVKKAAEAINLDATKKAADETKDAATAVKEQAEAAATALQATEPQLSGKDEALASIASAQESLAAFDAIDTTDMKEEQVVALNKARQTVQTQLDDAQAKVEAIAATTPAPDLTALNTATDTLAQKTEALGNATVDLSTVVDKTSAAQVALGEADAALQQTDTAFGAALEALAVLDQSVAGISAGTQGLATALTQAATGAQTLATQLQNTAASAPQILAGVDALSSGATQLTDALNATADGSAQLTSGLQTFNDEGVAKVVEALEGLDGDLSDATNRLDALREAARDYNNFAGKAEGQSGSVRFVFKTEQIG